MKTKIILGYTLLATGKFNLSKKHIAIFETIIKKGHYKPGYSDQEPATATLEKHGIIEWRGDFKGVILTEYGKELIETHNWLNLNI